MTPVRRLLVHGLLVAIGPETVELPREVGLGLRGSAPLGPSRLSPLRFGLRTSVSPLWTRQPPARC
ncbi:MAG: hypothetical protein WKF47_01875 [Geodermatophilaceae bacterium]